MFCEFWIPESKLWKLDVRFKSIIVFVPSTSVTGISPSLVSSHRCCGWHGQGPPLWWFRDTLSARYYRQPQWHRVKITRDTVITSHSVSAFLNSSSAQAPETSRGGCWSLNSNYHGIVFCVNITGADNAPEIGMKPPFLTAICHRICDNSMKQREWGTHVVIGQGEPQRWDRFGEGQTIFQDKIHWRVIQKCSNVGWFKAGRPPSHQVKSQALMIARCDNRQDTNWIMVHIEISLSNTFSKEPI